MRIPLRENGIWLGALALLLVISLMIAESVAIHVATRPVIVNIVPTKPTERTAPVTETDTERNTTEELGLGRSERHQALMSNPELSADQSALLEELDSLRAEEGDSPALLNDMGVVALRARVPAVAVEHFQDAIELYPDYSRAWYNLGIALGRVDRNEDAINAYRKALELTPGYQEAAMNLGDLLYDDGRLEEAQQAFALAADISSSSTRARALFLRGEVLATMGRHEEAVRVLRRSTEYNPREADTWLLLGESLLDVPDEADAALASLDNAASLRPDDVDIHLEIAHALHQHEDLEAAIRFLQRALQIDPANGDARRHLASLFMENGDLEAAQVQYGWLADNTDDAVSAARYRAELAYLRNELDVASAQLRRALELSEGQDLDSWLRLGLVLRKAGRSEEAFEEYDALLDAHPHNEAALTGAAGAALELGRYELAESHLQRALAIRETDPDIWFMYGRLEESRDNIDAAIEAYRHSLGIDPDYRGAALNLAILERRRGNADAAIEIYENILADNPRYSLARYNLAVVLSSLDRNDEAAGHYEQVLEQDPENEKARLNLAVIRRAEGRLEQAETLLRDGLAMDPSNISARFNLALLLGAMEREGEQEKELERVLRLDPGFAKAWRSLGRLHEARGELDAAAEAFLEALQLEPEDTAALVFNLGVRSDEEAQFELARRLYRALLEVDPAYSKAAINLAAIESRQGNPQDALDVLDDVLEREPENTAALFNRALALEALDKRPQAVTQLEALLALDPEHALAWRQLGLWQLGQDNDAEARQALETYLELVPDDVDIRAKLNTLNAGSNSEST